MSDASDGDKSLSASSVEVIDRICDRFESAWQQGERPPIAGCLAAVEEPLRPVLLRELLKLEIDYRKRSGEVLDLAGLQAQLPQYREVVEAAIVEGARSDADAGEAAPTTPRATDSDRQDALQKPLAGSACIHVRCPHCHNAIELVVDAPLVDIDCPSCGSHFSLVGGAETRTAAPVTQVAQFELVERLGMGAFGTVWKARDTILQRTVAIKIPRHGQLDRDEAERFMREARSVAPLQHPNIVTVHEVGRDGPSLYIVSDFVRGVPLSEVLADRRLRSREAVTIAGKIADALHHAHEHGVIHRDLKPQNIMIDVAGEPHLTDFGLAKREAVEITMTVEGAILGTPAYMSPEQARGEGHAVDRRADIYSLGVILFQMLTGELPFRGTPRMLQHKVLNEEPPSPRRLDAGIPKDLETICLRCMQKDPQRRYQTAQQVAEDLSRFLAGIPILARPIGSVERTWRWCKRNPVVATLGATVATLLVTIGVVGPWLAIKQTRVARENKRLADDAEAETMRAVRTLSASLAAQSDAVRDKQPQRSLLLAAEAVNVWQRHNLAPVIAAEQSLRDSLQLIGGRGLCDHHKDGVLALAVSNDGHWLATGSLDGTVHLFDLTSNKPNKSARVLKWQGDRVLERHECDIRVLAISPDNHWLVAGGGNDGVVRVCDLRAEDPAKAVRVLSHDSGVRWTAISADSRWLATEDQDTVKLWDLRNPDPANSARVLKIPPGSGYVTAVAMSADGRWVASGCSTGTRNTVRIWESDKIDPAKPARILQGYEKEIRVIVFSPDGRWVATAGGDGTRIWDLKSEPVEKSVRVLDDQPTVVLAISSDGRLLVTPYGEWDLTAPDPQKAIRYAQKGDFAGLPFWMAVSPDGRWLVGVLPGYTANTAQLRDKTNDATMIPWLRGHDDDISATVFTPDNRYLITGSYDGTVRLWDLTDDITGGTGQLLQSHAKNLSLMTTSSDGRWLAVSDADGNAVVWDLESEVPNEIARLAIGHEGNYFSGTITRDGRWLATEGGDNSVRLWDMNVSDPNKLVHILNNQVDVYAVAISEDGRWLVAGGESNARLWDLRAEEPDKSFRILEHEGSVLAVEISPNSRWLITADDWDQGTILSAVKIWDLRAEDPARTVRVLHRRVYPHALAISADSRWLAAADTAVTIDAFGWPASCAIGVWDLHAEDPAKTVRILDEHREYNEGGGVVQALAISPDSRWLASGGGDHTARIWDLNAATRVSTWTLEGHEGGIEVVAFSPDGRWLATGSDDNTARIWDLTSDEPQRSPRVLKGHTGDISMLAFAPNGRWVITGCYDDHTVRMWPLRLDDLMEQAKLALGRNFTKREWAETFPGEKYRKTFESLPVGR